MFKTQPLYLFLFYKLFMCGAAAFYHLTLTQWAQTGITLKSKLPKLFAF